MHTVAKKSHIGWRVATVLDQDELELEEKEESKLLSTKAITAAEKQYMTFQIDKAKTLQYSKNGAGYGGRGGSGGRGGRGGRSGRCGRGGKGAYGDRDSLNGVSPDNGGKVKKPRNGGCHRCGGPHFVRACPKPIQKD